MTATAPPATAPDLASVAAFGLAHLRADAIAVLDERSDPPALVARAGEADEALVSALARLPSRRRAGGAAILTALPEGAAISAPVAVEGGEGAGTLHALYRRGRPTAASEPMAQRAVVLGRQIGLVLAQESLTPASVSPVADGGWLVDLNVLPSAPEAVAQMTETVARGLRRTIGSTAACISVWDEERSVLRALPGAFGSSNQALGASVSGPPTNSHSLASRVFVTGRPYMTNRAAGDPGLLQQYVDVFGLARVLAVPLTIGSHRVGVLILVNKPAPFTVRDVSELEALAPQIAVAVKLALSMEKIRRSEAMERVLASAATAITAGRSLADSFTPALRELGQVTDSSMALLTPPGREPIVWQGRAVEASLQTRFRHEASEMARVSAGAFPHQAGDPGWAAVHAPAMLSGERVAAVSLLRQTGMPFGADEAETISRLADLAALAWASERYQRQASELALSRERARIADDLHDHVAQILFAAQIGVDSLLEAGPPDGDAEDRLVDVRQLLTRGEAAIRDVIAECSPTPEADLARRLELMVASVQEEFRIAVCTDLPAEDALVAVPRPVADCAVKVAHEGVVNAAKHAGPCRISLELAVDATAALVVDVRDDGRGRPRRAPFAAGHGLTSLSRSVDEVGGRLDLLEGDGGRGTRLRAVFDPSGLRQTEALSDPFTTVPAATSSAASSAS